LILSSGEGFHSYISDLVRRIKSDLIIDSLAGVRYPRRTVGQSNGVFRNTGDVPCSSKHETHCSALCLHADEQIVIGHTTVGYFPWWPIFQS